MPVLQSRPRDAAAAAKRLRAAACLTMLFLGACIPARVVCDTEVEQVLAEMRAWKPGDMERMVAYVRPALALVRHRGRDGGFVSGTGFFVSPDGLLLTCAHVVASDAVRSKREIAEKTWVRPYGSASTEATVVYIDRATDLAMLLVDLTSCPHIGMCPWPGQQGQEIAVFGFPGGDSLGPEPTVTKGIVSALRANSRVIQIDAAVNPGCSGGPVLASGGGVVGVAWAKLRGMEGTNLAISSIAIPQVPAMLLEAIRSKDFPKWNAKLANARDRAGVTAIMYAVLRKRRDWVETLLPAGGDINYADRWGNGALGNAGHDSALLSWLISKGANLEVKGTGGGQTLVFSTITLRDLPGLRLLLDKGARLDTRDKVGASPLHWAIRNGTSAIVRELLARGADVNSLDGSGCTPLHWAVQKGDAEDADLLRTTGGRDVGSSLWSDIDERYVHLFGVTVGN